MAWGKRKEEVCPGCAARAAEIVFLRERVTRLENAVASYNEALAEQMRANAEAARAIAKERAENKRQSIRELAPTVPALGVEEKTEEELQFYGVAEEAHG